MLDDENGDADVLRPSLDAGLGNDVAAEDEEDEDDDDDDDADDGAVDVDAIVDAVDDVDPFRNAASPKVVVSLGVMARAGPRLDDDPPIGGGDMIPALPGPKTPNGNGTTELSGPEVGFMGLMGISGLMGVKAEACMAAAAAAAALNSFERPRLV